MRKSFVITIFCIICVMLFQAFTISKEPRFKNLKILPQDIDEHGLDSVMHHFNASLGVRCNFCHAMNEAERKMDFSSDAKPEKDIARMMMVMSININKSYFQGMDEHHDHDMKGMDHDMKMDSSMKKPMDNNMMAMSHKMMDTTISQGDVKYMLQSITCFTCHRGDPHPESKAPMLPMGQKPGMPPPGMPPPQGPPPAGK